MAERKAAKKSTGKKTENKRSTKNKVKQSKSKTSKNTKSKKPRIMPSDDMGIVIVDDDITIDQEKVNEERRAYLEEARSQEAFD